MSPIVAVIAPGAMGAAVGSRLVEHGLAVHTVLAGRSQASVARAAAAGMQSVDLAQIAAADIILSIVPPGDAMSLAETLAPLIARADHKPLYADCNAVSPQTVERIGRVVAGSGARFVDAGIIGGPPRPGTPGPVFYTAGPDAPALDVLARHGLRITDLHGEVGAASGLKMSYAGITKGFTALGAAMMLAATRFGAAPSLAAELATSQPELLAWLRRQMPAMYSKAYRWVAEMDEIAAFAGEDTPSYDIYAGIADLYDRIAADEAGPRADVDTLDAFLRQS
jgi:3-hydroxyisobutyrate dehydrogenase-like beta-hydroxyacid dehydrogenase